MSSPASRSDLILGFDARLESATPRERNMANRRTSDESSRSGSMITPRLIVGLGSLVLLLLFVLQNSAQAEIGLLWFGVTAPVWAYFLIVFALGWVAGWVSHGRSRKQ
jgi:uncharacterized integral membrane protein